MKHKNLKATILSLLLAGCSSIPLEPAAHKVIVSPNQVPNGCKYIGQVVGNQGNFFSGGFTSNKNLEEGAMHDIKNKASKLGANYVQLITNRAGSTGSISGSSNAFGGGSSETNVTNLGNAYLCNPAKIGL